MREWHFYVDGASLGNPGHSGCAVVAFDEHRNEVWRYSLYLGEMTNNMAEYEGLLSALRKAREKDVAKVFIYTDSQLVAMQVAGHYKVKNQRLWDYVREAREIISNFSSFRVKYIPREENKLADKLAKDAASKKNGVDVWSQEQS